MAAEDSALTRDELEELESLQELCARVNASTRERIQVLRDASERHPEKTRELVEAGVKFDEDYHAAINYVSKEVAGVYLADHGERDRALTLLKELLDTQYPPYTYTVAGDKYEATDPTHRRHVVQRLSEYGAEDVLEEFRRLLGGDEDPYTLKIALAHLARHRDEAAIPLIKHLLEQDGLAQATRDRAERALERIQNA